MFLIKILPSPQFEFETWCLLTNTSSPAHTTKMRNKDEKIKQLHQLFLPSLNWHNNIKHKEEYKDTRHHLPDNFFTISIFIKQGKEGKTEAHDVYLLDHRKDSLWVDFTIKIFKWLWIQPILMCEIMTNIYLSVIFKDIFAKLTYETICMPFCSFNIKVLQVDEMKQLDKILSQT